MWVTWSLDTDNLAPFRSSWLIVTTPDRTQVMKTDNRASSAVIDPTASDLATMTTPTTHAIGSLASMVESARQFASGAKAPSTRRGYRTDWSTFCSWCAQAGVPALPASPEAVAAFVSSMAQLGRKVATLQHMIVAISQAHQHASHTSPTATAIVRETMKGIRRTIGVAQVQKSPVMPDQIRSMLAVLPDDLLGVRDRAILLLGFSGGFRRSELVGLDMQDIEFTTDGMVVTLRRSKTDQESAGRRVGIPFGSSPATCPVRSLRAWIDTAAVTEGPVFRPVGRWGHVGAGRLDDRAVARMVKRNVKAIGLEPARYAGHSLRAGLATSAARAGKSERSIMNQTGHRSVTMVRKYIREGNLFTENAAAGLL